MPDTAAPPPALEDRLGAIAGRIQNSVVAMLPFRPTSGIGEADKFDNSVNDMLTSLIEIAAAAAVDHAAILAAKDLSALRQEYMLSARKLRDQTDVDTQTQTAQVAESFLKIAASAGQ